MLIWSDELGVFVLVLILQKIKFLEKVLKKLNLFRRFVRVLSAEDRNDLLVKLCNFANKR